MTSTSPKMQIIKILNDERVKQGTFPYIDYFINKPYLLSLMSLRKHHCLHNN